MPTQIIDLSEYHVTPDGVLKLKSKWTKTIKAAIAVGITICGLFFVNASESHIYEGVKITPAEDIALINYVAKYNEADSVEIVQSTQRWADKFGLEVLDLLAIQRVESTFERYAVSGAGAMGLMQVMVKVHDDKIRLAKKELGNPEIFSVDTNIFIGAMIYKDCKVRNKLDTDAQKCYNGSLGMVSDYPNKVASAKREIRQVTNI